MNGEAVVFLEKDGQWKEVQVEKPVERGKKENFLRRQPPTSPGARRERGPTDSRARSPGRISGPAGRGRDRASDVDGGENHGRPERERRNEKTILEMVAKFSSNKTR